MINEEPAYKYFLIFKRIINNIRIEIKKRCFNKYLRSLSYTFSHISPPPLYSFVEVPMRGSSC